MSLLFKKPPRQIARAHQADLANFVNTGSTVFSLLLHSPKACQVYGLRKGDVCTAGVDLTKCVNDLGWRFLAGDSGGAGATHVGSVAGSAPKLTGFSGEQQVADAIAHLSDLEGLTGLPQGPFEVRLLRVAWLRFEAFWLHADGAADAKGDHVVPYTDFAAAPQVGLKVMKAYSAADFVNAIYQKVCAAAPPAPPGTTPRKKPPAQE
jgi:hypothetical protein